MHKKAFMSRPPLALSSPAPRRLGLVRALVFLWLLGGLLWSWNQAQASPADSEMVFFMVDAEADAAQELAAEWAGEGGCREPVPLKPTPADLLCHEVDQAARLRWQISRGLTQAAPVPGPQHILPEAGQQPLLRPPAALG
jgi:hypothetical protein